MPSSDFGTVRAMTPFAADLASWHDFYLAVASASAAILGLVFVAVSIRVSTLGPDERPEITTRANLAFSNLLYLLGVSLVVLLPDVEASTVAISFAVIAVLGLLRIVRHVRTLVRSARGRLPAWATTRRLAWTVVADLFLGWIALQLATTGDGRYLLGTPVVTLLLMLAAADVAWDLLVHE